MDIKSVALNMAEIVEGSTGLPEYHPEYGVDHLTNMCASIYNGDVTGDKAHRWLGWIQGCLCMAGEVTLEELKEINKDACNGCDDCDCKK